VSEPLRKASGTGTTTLYRPVGPAELKLMEEFNRHIVGGIALIAEFPSQ
jgi:hypothetical protein